MIYYIADEHSRIKIGFTENQPFQRLNSLQSGNADKLTLIAAHSGIQLDEKRIHRCFQHLRKDGCREWFHASNELLDYVINIKDANLQFVTQMRIKATEIDYGIQEQQLILADAKAEATDLILKAQRKARHILFQASEQAYENYWASKGRDLEGNLAKSHNRLKLKEAGFNQNEIWTLIALRAIKLEIGAPMLARAYLFGHKQDYYNNPSEYQLPLF